MECDVFAWALGALKAEIDENPLPSGVKWELEKLVGAGRATQPGTFSVRRVYADPTLTGWREVEVKFHPRWVEEGGVQPYGWVGAGVYLLPPGSSAGAAWEYVGSGWREAFRIMLRKALEHVW